MRPTLASTLPRTRIRPRRRRTTHGRHLEMASIAQSPAPALKFDPEVERVREAGGPIDNAAYGCACGYSFRASVSTTVNCPHCGAAQAW